MLLIFPMLFSLVLTIGLMMAVVIGFWVHDTHGIKATYVTTVILTLVAVVLGKTSFDYLQQLGVTPAGGDYLLGKILVISAAIPALVALGGAMLLIGFLLRHKLAGKPAFFLRTREMV